MLSPRSGKPVYSVTALMVYEECPRQYYLTFVQRIPPLVTPAMRKGTTIHGVIARHLQQPSFFPPQVDPDLQPLMDTFLGSRFNAAPLALEMPFSLPLSAAIVCGRIDALFPRGDRGIEIVDFKSGRGRPMEEMARRLQLPVYGLWASGHFERSPDDLTYTYFFLSDGAEVSFSPSAEDVSTLSARVGGLVAAIQSGNFEAPVGCSCQSCRSAD
jgi:hypothetical protein